MSNCKLLNLIPRFAEPDQSLGFSTRVQSGKHTLATDCAWQLEARPIGKLWEDDDENKQSFIWSFCRARSLSTTEPCEELLKGSRYKNHDCMAHFLSKWKQIFGTLLKYFKTAAMYFHVGKTQWWYIKSSAVQFHDHVAKVSSCLLDKGWPNHLVLSHLNDDTPNHHESYGAFPILKTEQAVKVSGCSRLCSFAAE